MLKNDSKGSPEGGMNTMCGLLTRFPQLAVVFTINDPQTVGSEATASQQHRDHLGGRRA